MHAFFLFIGRCEVSRFVLFAVLFGLLSAGCVLEWCGRVIWIMQCFEDCAL